MSVVLKNAVKSFGGHRAIDGISVDIPSGEFFAVLGASGCGKSTLLRLIAGLETLEGGQILLDGQPVSADAHHTPPEARHVGFVFQSYALWPHMNVLQNVAFPIETTGKSRKDAACAAAKHLETVALQDYADRSPAELSGGQRQRVALARCLAGGARTVLMDEPLANLDPHLRHTMEGELLSFHKSSGVTTLYITHDQREAMTLADRVAVMANGRFLQVAPPTEIYEQPNCEEVARFIGRCAILDAECYSGGVHLGEIKVPTPNPPQATGPARIVIRPRDVTLHFHPAPNTLAAHITTASYRGGEWEALAQINGITEAIPVRHSSPLKPGQEVFLQINNCWRLNPATE
jgi:iron(III) transport system ATP-binding protein